MFAPIIKASKKDNMILKRVFYIYYFGWFKKDEIKVLINSGSKFNTILPRYALK